MAVNKLESTYETSGESPGFLLWRTVNAWQRQIRAALKPFDLTHTQFVLLAVLTYSGEPMNQKTLAEHAHTDLMMTSQVLRALETRGLVVRTQDPSDKRAIVVRSSEEGAKAAIAATSAVENVDAKFFGAQGSHMVALLNALPAGVTD